uniref:Ig-like domain-containing protein n=1 Tax=Pelusios castaneus TaxID=367368 RepID=A0A8C8RXL1_9SAUR
MAHRSDISKGNFSMILSQVVISDAGTYVCVVGSQHFRVQLQVFKVTGFPSLGYLLQNENLTLNIEGSSGVSVTWFDNHKIPVTHQPQSRELKESGRSLYIYSLQTKDNGIWTCHITYKSAQLDIPYNVRVIGFYNNSRPETLYASVNSTVSFSYLLNTDLQMIGERETINGALEWKQKEDGSYQKKFSFTVTSKESVLPKSIDRLQLTGKTSSHLQVKLPKVRFEDAGWYRCQFMLSHRTMEKAIHVVGMRVSANPVGPLSKGAKVTLLCQLSAPLLPGAQLFWKHMNGTEQKTEMEGDTVEVITNSTGQWTCSLKVQDKVEISMCYTVEKAAEWNIYVLVVAGVGTGVVLLLLVSLLTFTCTARQRRRRRAEKMARIRQDLLEKRTCQCQRWLKNDYTHYTHA